MSAPDNESQFAGEVARLRKMTIANDARVNWTLAVSLIAGVVVGIGVWFIQRPMDRDDVHFGLALGLGLATFMFGGGLVRIIRGPMPKAKCPQCERAWEIPGDEPVWLTWNCCPGCGLKMNDEC